MESSSVTETKEQTLEHRLEQLEREARRLETAYIKVVGAREYVAAMIAERDAAESQKSDH